MKIRKISVPTGLIRDFLTVGLKIMGEIDYPTMVEYQAEDLAGFVRLLKPVIEKHPEVAVLDYLLAEIDTLLILCEASDFQAGMTTEPIER